MLAKPSSAPRGSGRLREKIASGRLTNNPSASAVTLTRTWLPR